MSSLWKRLISGLTNSALWRARSESERKTLIVGAMALSLMLIFQFGYKPITQAMRTLRSQTQTQADQLIVLRSQLAARKVDLAAQPQNTVPSLSSSMSLAAVLEGTLTEAGFKGALKKIEPLSETAVRVELGGVNFDALITTLESLSKNQRVSVQELSLDAIAPSTVSARMTFSR